MPIEFYKEKAGANVATGAFGAVKIHADTSPQFQAIKNCVNLIDSIQLCYELDLSNFLIKVCVTAPVVGTIGCWILDKNNTCVHIGADVGLASISVDVCVDWNAKKITLKGKACAFGQCTNWDVVLLQW
jgi:hypothetical protein